MLLERINLGEAVQPELSSIYPVQWTSRKKFNAKVLAISTLENVILTKYQNDDQHFTGSKEDMEEEEAAIVKRRNELECFSPLAKKKKAES